MHRFRSQEELALCQEESVAFRHSVVLVKVAVGFLEEMEAEAEDRSVTMEAELFPSGTMVVAVRVVREGFSQAAAVAAAETAVEEYRPTSCRNIRKAMTG